MLHFKNAEEAEKHILKMVSISLSPFSPFPLLPSLSLKSLSSIQVEAGTLSATIDQQHKYIEFSEDKGYTSYQMVEYLGEQIRDTITLHRRIAAFDRGIETSERFLIKVCASVPPS
jgi:hypothetical protein